jgi:hypothetical protein
MSRRCTAEELKGLPPVPEGAQAVMLQKGDAVPLFALWPADGEWRSGVCHPGSTVPAEMPVLVPGLAPSWMRVDSEEAKSWLRSRGGCAAVLAFWKGCHVCAAGLSPDGAHVVLLGYDDATHIMPLPAAPEVEA